MIFQFSERNPPPHLRFLLFKKISDKFIHVMIRKWFKINKGDITIVQFILEGYEGFATVSTIDPQTAILQVLIIPEFIEDVDGILDHLKDQFKLQEMAAGGQQALPC